jgi:DNA repair protein RecO (recombination protein O)
MLHSTKGIVLRTVKYGETSVIVLIFTEKLGVQSYLINGVRASSRKGTGKANLFQPAALLDLVVYQNERKQLNRIREFKWAHIYTNIFSDVPKNAVSLFMVELLTKCLKQPEPNNQLFQFCEDAFIHLDESSLPVMANFSLYFALHLSSLLGFQIHDSYSSEKRYLDLREGAFAAEQPEHPDFMEDRYGELTSDLLKVMQPAELEQIKLSHETRRRLLQAYEVFFALHVPEFGRMKTLPVLREVLG